MNGEGRACSQVCQVQLLTRRTDYARAKESTSFSAGLPRLPCPLLSFVCDALSRIARFPALRNS